MNLFPNNTAERTKFENLIVMGDKDGGVVFDGDGISTLSEELEKNCEKSDADDARQRRHDNRTLTIFIEVMSCLSPAMQMGVASEAGNHELRQFTSHGVVVSCSCRAVPLAHMGLLGMRVGRSRGTW